MNSSDPFKYVNSILDTKVYLMKSAQDEKDYDNFLTTRALSMHIDALLHANEINQYRDVPERQHYDYCFHSIRKMKRRYGKWPKKPNYALTDMLMAYYQVNRKVAEQYQTFLSNEQIQTIKERMTKGG